MAMRWGPGPVFAYEWLMLARRWQLYAGRGLFILMLFAGLSIVWQTEVARNPAPLSIRQQALVGEKFFYALIGIQLTLVMLAAPAATAGAICQDKTRGTLAHLLVTDLSSWEIILGKLAVRLGPVLGLIGCSVPILFMGSLFGGIDLEALIFAYLITIAVGILGCALALFLSVWAAKTHEVLVVVYLTWCLLLLAGPIWHVAGWYFPIGAPPSWFDDRNAFWLAFAPYSDPKATDWRDDLGFVGVSLALSALLVLLAVLRVLRGGSPADESLRAETWIAPIPKLLRLLVALATRSIPGRQPGTVARMVPQALLALDPSSLDLVRGIGDHLHDFGLEPD